MILGQLKGARAKLSGALGGWEGFKATLFWTLLPALAALAVYVAYRDVRDTRGGTVVCSAAERAEGQEAQTAYLTVKEFDSSTRQAKALVMVTNFDPSRDTLKVEAVSRVTPGSRDIELHSLVDTSEGEDKSDAGWYALSLPYDSQPFFYPFEDYALNFRIKLEREGVPVPVILEAKNQIAELIPSGCSTRYSFEAEDEKPLPLRFRGNAFYVVLNRHRFVRVISLILLFVSVFFLVYIATREEASKVLTNSLGYLAALWGIRQIIVGYAKLFPTAIDFVTMALYVSVVAIVVNKLFLGSKPTRPPARKHRLR